MFSVSSGGVDIAKNTLAPHTKIATVMSVGITIQLVSSRRPPSIGTPTLCGARRLYFTA